MTKAAGRLYSFVGVRVGPESVGGGEPSSRPKSLGSFSHLDDGWEAVWVGAVWVGGRLGGGCVGIGGRWGCLPPQPGIEPGEHPFAIPCPMFGALFVYRHMHNYDEMTGSLSNRLEEMK